MKSILKRGMVAAMVLSMGAAPLAAHASNDDSNGWERHSHHERGERGDRGDRGGDRMDGFDDSSRGRGEHRGHEHRDRGDRGDDRGGEHRDGDREGRSIPPDRGTNEP